MEQPSPKLTSPWLRPSVFVLVGSNILVLLLAALQGWEIRSVIWAYWLQCVIIIFFSYLKILRMENFSVEGLRTPRGPLAETQEAKNSTAHYAYSGIAFFYVVYLVFLLVLWYPQDWNHVALGAAVYLVNHLISYLIFLLRKEYLVRQSIGKMINAGIGRTLAIHFFIILGGWFGAIGDNPHNLSAILLLVILKTFFDLSAHISEHDPNKKMKDGFNMGGAAYNMEPTQENNINK